MSPHESLPLALATSFSLGYGIGVYYPSLLHTLCVQALFNQGAGLHLKYRRICLTNRGQRNRK